MPVDPNPNHRWIGQGVRTAFSTYNKITAFNPTDRWPSTAGGLWDIFARSREDIRDDFLMWASDSRMQDDWGMCQQLAGLTSSQDQWNAYNSVIIERLRETPRAPRRIITRSILPI